MSQYELLTAPIVNAIPSLVNLPKSISFPQLSGTQCNWALLGTLTLQVYKFHICFQKERAWTKCLVYGIFLMQTAETAITSHFAFSLLVVRWGDPTIFVKLPWSSLATPIFTGITSALVQTFFAWRIYILKGENMVYRVVAGVIVMLALMQSLAAIISDTKFAVTTEVAELENLIKGVKVWLVGSAVADVVIALTMIVILSEYRRKTPWKRTDSLITKLIYNTIETGAITSVLAICDVTLFILFPQNNLHQTFAFMLGKVYANVLMVTLNARAISGTPSGLAGSKNYSGETNNHELTWRRQTNNNAEARRVHISTVTEVTHDSELDDKVYSPGGGKAYPPGTGV
ncbi:hypothetical protein DFH07DRAFT_1063455 [Mycena maculata]|uniref:DUF6534 domain-containing protein n=1 Tax=Mycena maculata TaxID=230809 RepID=A0AAD7IIN1_9AGAR|nr:hypothetical protein DFH07DRAFT_1063455 [Mycena maculata]